MSNTLAERISKYMDASDYRLLPKLPVAILLNGRSFQKITDSLTKPYDPDLMQAICLMAVKLVHEAEGSVFAYVYHDEIVLICRNDRSIYTEPWYENRIQKIGSVCASVATLEFNRICGEMGLRLIGDPIFTSYVFAIPNLTELTNLLIARQQLGYQRAVTFASFYEMRKRFDNEQAAKMLINRSISERIDIIYDECDVDFNTYPLEFRYGAALYRATKVIQTESAPLKAKWIIDSELPLFAKQHEFLNNIFSSGSDIVRAERDF